MTENALKPYNARNTYNRSTLSVLCVKSLLASLVLATTDGCKQQRYDVGRNQRNDPRRFTEDLFQPQRQESNSKETQNSRPRAKFNRKSNGPPKREVTG